MICTLSIAGLVAWWLWLRYQLRLVEIDAEREAQRACEKRWAAELALKDPPP